MQAANQITYRKIIHIDMDAFYASVEQRDNPDYRNKPLVVGGSPEGRGGVVATASYEARAFGIRSAMPCKQALQLCPHALFVRPRFDAYKEVSLQIRAIFRRYTDLIEPLSLDEAYLDVTTDKLNIGSAIEIATQIKHAIKNELALTASAGVSINKFVAKIASDINKPDGLKFIGPSAITAFMESLPVEKFHGIGKVTAAKMKTMGIFTGADLKKLSREALTANFGKPGLFYFDIVRGNDERPVQPDRETKSLAAEDTFAEDLTEFSVMASELERLAVLVSKRLQAKRLLGRTVTVKIRYNDFKQITRSRSLDIPIDGADDIAVVGKDLLQVNLPDGKKVRLLGLSVSQLSNAAGKTEEQLRLF